MQTFWADLKDITENYWSDLWIKVVVQQDLFFLRLLTETIVCRPFSALIYLYVVSSDLVKFVYFYVKVKFVIMYLI